MISINVPPVTGKEIIYMIISATGRRNENGCSSSGRTTD